MPASLRLKKRIGTNSFPGESDREALSSKGLEERTRVETAEPIPSKIGRIRNAGPRIAAQFVFAFAVAFSASTFLDAPPPISPEQERSRHVPPGMRCGAANLCEEDEAPGVPAKVDRARSFHRAGEPVPGSGLHP